MNTARFFFFFSQGVFGPGDLQLSPLHAGPCRWQWLGLCLSLPADYLLLVPAAGLRRAACAHSQGDPAGSCPIKYDQSTRYAHISSFFLQCYQTCPSCLVLCFPGFSGCWRQAGILRRVTSVDWIHWGSGCSESFAWAHFQDPVCEVGLHFLWMIMCLWMILIYLTTNLPSL